jgi:ribosome-associated protein
MALEITPSVTIPDSDLSYAFVKASGPGGQNVNKVSSAVQLRFDLEGSTALSEPVKSRLRPLAGRRLTDDGAILIIARNQRSQEHNRRELLGPAAGEEQGAPGGPRGRPE